LFLIRVKYEQAEPLYLRALAIYERGLGPSHSTTAQIRENYTKLLQKRGQKAGAADVQDRI
jgi:hypothetical protein